MKIFSKFINNDHATIFGEEKVMLKKTRSGIMMLLIFVAILPQVLKASITVNFGETASGSIGTAGEVDAYVFSAITNDTILVRMSRISSSLWPALTLYSPHGTELKTDYGSDVAEVNCTLAETGEYTVSAFDYWGDNTGNYSVFFQRLNNPGNAMSVKFGETVSGSIDPAGDVDTYSFSATAGDSVLVRASQTSGYLYPEVRLYAPDGTELGRDWGWGVAELTSTLAEDGNYTILVHDHYGDYTGNYTLHLSEIVFEELTPSNPYVGNISMGEWHSFYVSVEADKNLLVTLESTSSTGILELYGRYGQAPTQSDCDYLANRRNVFGNYELLISPTENGTYYFGVYGKDVEGLLNYTITALIVERYVSNVYPRILTNSTRATVHISGVGFTDGMRVELRGGNAVNISADTVVFSSSKMVFAHFDLSNASLGIYDVAVIWPDNQERIIQAAVEVNELQEGTLYSLPDLQMDEGATFTFDIGIPEISNLFVTLQKTTLVSYGDSWSGELSLMHEGIEVASTSGSHDLILHIVNPDPGVYTVKVTAHQAGSGILNVWTSLPELPLGEWVVGTIYTSYGSIWYQVEVPPDQDSLCFEAEAMGLWSHFDIYYEEYGSSDHWVSRQGTQTSIEIPNPAPGTYIVEFMDSAMLYDGYRWSEDQTRDVFIRADTTFSVEPPPNYLPTITSISTDRGGNTGFVTVEIRGGWLDPNATVSVVRSGQEDIVAHYVYGSSDGTTLTALLDLTDKEAGEWNLVVTNPDGQSATAPGVFTIEETGKPEVWAEIVGREKIRLGREQTYVIRCGNRGSVDAHDLLLWLETPPSWQVKIDLPTAEFSESMKKDNLTFCIWISKLPAGTISEFTLHVTSQEVTDEEVKLGLVSSPPLQGSQWFPPNEKPPVGSIAFRLSKGGLGPGHVGLVVDDWKVVDLVLKQGGSYEVQGPFDIRDKWHEGEGGEGLYLGAGVSDGWTIEKGKQIAEHAKNRVGETGKYWVVPFPDDTKNCIKFVGEAYRSVELNLRWWAITTPASAYEGLSHRLWPEYRWAGWILAPSNWLGLWVVPLRWLEFKRIRAVMSTTPEDKYGPTGFDLPDTQYEELKRFVPSDQNFYYKVDFWNKENATAPACDVFVKDQLDIDFDWSTFRFEEIGFLNWTVELEPCQYFNVYVDTRPQMNLIVNVEGTFDLKTGEISWTFRSLDPTTMETPEDPMAGFLPPITESGFEVGWVCFSVNPKTDLPTGTHIENQAFVNFDGVGPYNPAPKEGPFVNTIDSAIPTSWIKPLPATHTSPSFTLEWEGNDTDGSGIRDYTIYVSENGTNYVPLLEHTTKTSIVFNGSFGHTYRFFSCARDNVGNVESISYEAEATTAIVLAPQFTTSNLTISPTEVQIGENVTISVLVSNNGSAEGTYQLVLKINGTIETAMNITLAAGASQNVTFIVSRNSPDNYTVEVDGFTAQFAVKALPEDWMVPLVVVGIVLTVGAIIAIIFLKKRKGAH